jgi:predicted phosphate transport protein (TIGR00153 family)
VTFQVIPRERAFFDLLERAADGVADGARELAALVDELPHGEERWRRIQDLEHAGDDMTHRILSLLANTFVTPMDRQDIHRLASWLDDVLDSQEAVSDLLILHGVAEPIPQLRQQADVLVRSTEAVVQVMRSLRSYGANGRTWADITRLEREGDRIYRRGVAALFSGEYRAMDVLKWKDILHEMEQAIDRCEDIADTVESIVLKHA